eukprot:SAG31_NODE_26246_length_445_cov_3.118497_1_plen_97_part_01
MMIYHSLLVLVPGAGGVGTGYFFIFLNKIHAYIIARFYVVRWPPRSAPYLANQLAVRHLSRVRRAHDTEACPSTRRNSVPPSVHATIGAPFVLLDC